MESLGMIQPVILAGGSGTRLWPTSREHKPKQYLSLIGKSSMMQQALARLDGLACLSPILICNEKHRFLAAEQLREVGVNAPKIILEPIGRNTAPAIALAALAAADNPNEDPLLLVLAADHVIQDVEAFHHSIREAQVLAAQGHLVTFGIVPTKAETGYGYIRRGAALAQGWQIKEFVEKPDTQTAEQYLASGDYLWNSGMFMLKASRAIQELSTHCPDILSACQAALKLARPDLDFVRIDGKSFSECPTKSFDYAVMEHTHSAAVVALDAGWSDVGAWDALATVLTCDSNRNCLQGDVMAEDISNTLIHAEHRLVAALGVQNLVVIETKDAVLVANKTHSQNVKRIVERLKAEGRTEHIQHREVYRPWGTYDSIGNGPRYQVKKITVKPGGKLSVQMHHHRAEHWVVVSGTAKVTNGDRTYIVAENESTYIPIGQIHCLENPGVIPLELIEVQSGAYLGEDDIVRFKDQYGRA